VQRIDRIERQWKGLEMTMNIDDPACLDGATVIGVDGQKLGSVDAVYFDNTSDRPQWVAVRGGLFGTRVALVPLRRADYTDEALRVPFDKVQLRHAPHHDTGHDLSAADEMSLYRYYGIDYADESAETVEFQIDAADVEPADRARLRRHDAGLQERRSL
jgi:sporulation protein YlmC with PRC-barrel domain